MLIFFFNGIRRTLEFALSKNQVIANSSTFRMSSGKCVRRHNSHVYLYLIIALSLSSYGSWAFIEALCASLANPCCKFGVTFIMIIFVSMPKEKTTILIRQISSSGQHPHFSFHSPENTEVSLQLQKPLPASSFHAVRLCSVILHHPQSVFKYTSVPQATPFRLIDFREL